MVYAWDADAMREPTELGRWKMLNRHEDECAAANRAVRVMLPERLKLSMVFEPTASESVMQDILLVPFNFPHHMGYVRGRAAQFASKNDQDRFFVWLYDIEIDKLYVAKHPRRRKSK